MRTIIALALLAAGLGSSTALAQGAPTVRFAQPSGEASKGSTPGGDVLLVASWPDSNGTPFSWGQLKADPDAPLVRAGRALQADCLRVELAFSGAASAGDDVLLPATWVQFSPGSDSLVEGE